MAKRENEFSWSNAWVFASIGNHADADTGVGLSKMIETGDMLNHAILLTEEVVDALPRLHAHGLIEVVDDTIRLTEHGRLVFDNGFARRGGLFEVVNNMEKALNTPRIKHPVVEELADFSFVTEESMQQAYRAYRKRPK